MKNARVMKGLLIVAIPVSVIMLIAGLYDAFLGEREDLVLIVIGAGGLSSSLLIWKNLKQQSSEDIEE